MLVVDERGRVDDDAILGSTELPLRAFVLDAPDARFLRTGERYDKHIMCLRRESLEIEKKARTSS